MHDDDGRFMGHDKDDFNVNAYELLVKIKSLSFTAFRKWVNRYSEGLHESS